MQSVQCCSEGPSFGWKWTFSATQAPVNTTTQSTTSHVLCQRFHELRLRLYMSSQIRNRICRRYFVPSFCTRTCRIKQYFNDLQT